MEPADQKDIIKKVKSSGRGDDDAEMTSDDTSDEEPSDDSEMPSDDTEMPSDDTQEPEDDSDNLFETEMLGEMSLNDYKAQGLIRLYDESEGETKKIIFRKITLDNPFDEKDEKDKELNRQKFLNDLQDDFDKEYLEDVIRELKEIGIYGSIDENNIFLANLPKNNMFQEGSNDILDEKDDRCTRIAKRKYDVWPSAYASGAVVKCRQGKIWKGVDENYLQELDGLEEKWSEKYKKSIDCNNPKGFSQKAHCQGRKKHE